MLKNLGATLDSLRPKLKQYLQKQHTFFRGRLFTCPNKNAHKNQDVKPGCNFVDAEETKFYCFVCGSKGDLFDAVHLIEGRPITGSGFHETVEYLCKLLKVPYQLADETPESKFMQDVDQFLSAMVKKGHENLKHLLAEDLGHEAVKFLVAKGWVNSVDDYNLGVILNVQETKSQKIQDICNFLNLDLKDLTSGILIPIEFKQKLIGFQIRSLDPNAANKYKTYLTTSKGLFNLDKIDPSQTVYVVEGASSVIVLHQFGVTNVVATLGNGFNEAHYESLVAREVKNIIVVYDNDDGGRIGRDRACEICVGKPDLILQFKILNSTKDPADYMLSGKKLDELPTLSLWEYLLQEKHQSLLLKHIASQGDLIQKEKMVNELSKLINVTKTVIVEEVQKLEATIPSVPTIKSLKEKEALIETINTFEKWAWSRGDLLGVKSFDCFDKSFDGLQEGLILLGGSPNIGKSALATSIACKVMDRNPDAYVVYISIDDSALITTARFLANLSGIPINVVSNPKYRIVENKYYTDAERQELMVKREKALDYLRRNVSMFNLKDAANGYTIEYLNNLFISLEPIIKEKRVVLVVDNLHKLRSEKDFKSDKSLVDMVCGNLKILSSKYKCPVIATVEHTKQAIQLGEVGGSAIKETSSLHYDANLILTVVLKQVVGTFKLIDVVVSKNKMSTFIGTLPFRLLPDLSKMEEAEGSLAMFGGNADAQVCEEKKTTTTEEGSQKKE